MRRVLQLLAVFACVQARFGLSGALHDTLGPGTIVVDGFIWIEAGDSLIVRSGTVFNFTGSYSFDLHGTLRAQGTQSDSIFFTTDLDVNPAGWMGLRFHEGSDGSILTYCVIENGHAHGGPPFDCGGGVYCESAPNFQHCSIRNNRADADGGGVYCTDASPIFSNCSITGNTATSSGGGSACRAGASPSFTDCVFGDNVAQGGGGVYCNASSPSFVGCTFNGNGAAGNGGAVACWEGSNPGLVDCIITDNTASGAGEDNGGGGVYCNFSHPSLLRCSVTGNEAHLDGGGALCASSNARFTNCLFSGNTANGDGGGACVKQTAHPVFEFCTFSDNIAGGNGGGACCDTSFMEFNSTIVVFSQGVGIYFYGGGACNGCPIVHCDFFSNSAGDFGGPAVPESLGIVFRFNRMLEVCDKNYNIFRDPCFANRGAGDFHLLDNSHCISMADPERAVNLDFENDARPNPDATVADIGMDESPSFRDWPFVRGTVVYWPDPPLGSPLHLWWQSCLGSPLYKIWGSPDAGNTGYVLDTTTDTTWTDYTAPNRPSRWFYYVTAEWPDSL